jgi:hypothetical protein
MIFSPTPAQVKGANIERSYPDIMLDAVCVTILIAYFLHFALPALRGGFRADEMMNLGIYWYAGTLRSLRANVVFWTTFYRPGGALYYLPLYHFFALDPLPYRIVQISVLAASIPVAYYLSRCLTSSRSVAFLAVLTLCYHPQLASLLFIGAFIYDVLCGFFYFAALTYYVHIREKDVCPRPLQLLGFLGLYVCALNSKEMAVTLPLIILIYELLKSPHWTDWQAFFRWSWSAARPSLVAGALTAIYIFGKMHGTASLTRYDTYRPIISWHRFTASNAEFVTELLLFGQHAITPTTLLVLWAGVFIYAFLRRDRTLQLMAFWIVIVPLPIAFVLPLRGGPCLYLLLFGWAMIFAKVVVDLIELISKSAIFASHGGGKGTAAEGIGDTVAGRVRSAAIGSALDPAANKMSPRIFRVVALLSLACALAIFTQWENRHLGTVAPLLATGEKVSHVIKTVQSLHLQPAPESNVLLRTNGNLFSNNWHSLFIASLVWNDHSLRIWLEGAHKLTQQQIADMDYIISFSEFEAKVVRSPDNPKSD